MAQRVSEQSRYDGAESYFIARSKCLDLRTEIDRQGYMRSDTVAQ